MVTRRDWLRSTAAAGAALSLNPRILRALASQEMITRPVPSTGEELPIVGLGSSATFQRVARGDDVTQLEGVMQALVDGGGTVFDTAPGYGSSEEVAGAICQDLGISERIFWATKVNVAGRGGGSADPDAARAQIERSFEYFGVPVIDLIQVHNLGDPPVQVGILEELKAAGRVRYVGITSTSERRYAVLAQTMRDYPLDFIGIDYAVDNVSAAEEILPLAAELKIGVLVYVPFGRTRLWSRVGDREVPDWASEFDAHSWAQFFIKFAAAHPAVTVVTPATSRAEHMVDNLGGGMGRLPDEDQQARMIEYVSQLPEAG
ncbi:aldo/keto reductase [Candidatus Palauibacter sp.]|uniref:aldo/keto reductase n=1 Tax=Candidatus Palauibacter sp. TaxID=3101350 RepID=UPI003B59B537